MAEPCCAWTCRFRGVGLEVKRLPRRFARTMYGWLPRGKGFSVGAGVFSVAAIYTASGLQHVPSHQRRASGATIGTCAVADFIRARSHRAARRSGSNRVPSAICPSFAIISRCTCLLGRGCAPSVWFRQLCCHLEFGLVLHQRIGRARHPVGQCDRGLLGLLGLCYFSQPVFSSLTPTARTDLRDGPEIEQPPQIPVAHPGDTPQ